MKDAQDFQMDLWSSLIPKMLSTYPQRSRKVKHMKAEEAIRKCILTNPGQAPNRSRALEIIFGLLGSGLEWHDGEVVDKCKDNYLNSDEPRWWDPRTAIQRKIDELQFMTTDEDKKPQDYSLEIRSVCCNTADGYDYHAKNYVAHNAAMQETIDKIEQCVKHTPIPDEFYPLCDLSILSTIPDDVKPDWLDAAEEYARLVLRTDKNFKKRDAWEVNKESHKQAKKAIKRVKQIRKERS